jgi:serine protease AprX
VALFATLVASPADAQRGPRAGRGKLDAALSGGDVDKRPRVIVQYRNGSGERVRKRVEARGGRIRREHRIIGAVSMEVNRDDLSRLAEDPDVLRVSIDAKVRGGDRRNRDDRSPRNPSRLKTTIPHLRQIVGAPAHATGRNIGVAVVDSGIAASPDLTIAASVDFTGPGEPVWTSPSDAYGHGTHVAGLIAGNGAQSGGLYGGIAPGVRLYSLKVLDEKGEGYTSDVIQAIDTAAMYPEYIQILNVSLGHPIFESPETDPLVLAVEGAARKGILVVVSAGNHGYDDAGAIGYAGITSPGNAPSALTVGSIATGNTVSRLDDRMSDFSSRGPTWLEGRIKPDIVAPGEDLVAVQSPTSRLYAKKKGQRVEIGPYLRLSGTSMSAAIVTGVAALIMEANYVDEGIWKPLTPNAIKAILQYTAIAVPDLDPSTPDALEQGSGAVNAAGAVALARAIEPAAQVGSFWLEASVSPASAYDGVLYSWAQHLVWGDHLVGGDAILWSLSAWDEHVVWGDHVVWSESEDQHIVWGDVFTGVNLVLQSFRAWSTHIVWGDNLVSGSSDDFHIVWGDLFDEHIVWGDDFDDEHLVWGDTAVTPFGL